MSGHNVLTLEHAQLAREARNVSALTTAARKTFEQPDLDEALCVAPALYGIRVHDRRTDELLGTYPADSGDLGLDRARAVEAATTDAERNWNWQRADLEGAGPPDGSQVYCVEEWR